MKTNIYIVIVALIGLVLSPMYVSAQEGLAENNRELWIKEIRKYKHEHLAKELTLSEEQQDSFFPIYDEMEEELEKVNAKTRDAVMEASTNEEATDAELEEAARMIFEQKRTEGQIEIAYFEKFKEILTPQQLIKLKDAESAFMYKLMNIKKRNRNNRK